MKNTKKKLKGQSWSAWLRPLILRQSSTIRHRLNLPAGNRARPVRLPSFAAALASRAWSRNGPGTAPPVFGYSRAQWSRRFRRATSVVAASSQTPVSVLSLLFFIVLPPCLGRVSNQDCRVVLSFRSFPFQAHTCSSKICWPQNTSGTKFL